MTGWRRWIFVGVLALAPTGLHAADGLVQTVKGKVLRVTESELELKVGKEALIIAKDPLSSDPTQGQVKPGDEVLIKYVREIREIQPRHAQKAGKVPKQIPKPQEDDRIFYNS